MTNSAVVLKVTSLPIQLKVDPKPVQLKVSNARGPKGDIGQPAIVGFGLEFQGLMRDGDRLGVVLSDPLTIKEAKCKGKGRTNATNTTTGNIEHNGVVVGTVVVNAGTKVGVFTITGDEIVGLEDDEIDVVFPIADATLSNFKVTLAGDGT